MPRHEFQMLPEHAFEAGVKRAHRVAEQHGDERGPRVDHPEVLASIIRWAAIVADLQRDRDREMERRRRDCNREPWCAAAEHHPDCPIAGLP